MRVLSTWMASKTSESQDDSIRRTHRYRILRDAALDRGETRAKDPEKNGMSQMKRLLRNLESGECDQSRCGWEFIGPARYRAVSFELKQASLERDSLRLRK